MTYAMQHNKIFFSTVIAITISSSKTSYFIGTKYLHFQMRTIASVLPWRLAGFHNFLDFLDEKRKYKLVMFAWYDAQV